MVVGIIKCWWLKPKVNKPNLWSFRNLIFKIMAIIVFLPTKTYIKYGIWRQCIIVMFRNISYLVHKSPAVSAWIPLLNNIAEYSGTTVMCWRFPRQSNAVTPDIIILEGTRCCWHTWIMEIMILMMLCVISRSASLTMFGKYFYFWYLFRTFYFYPISGSNSLWKLAVKMAFYPGTNWEVKDELTCWLSWDDTVRLQRMTESFGILSWDAEEITWTFL